MKKTLSRLILSSLILMVMFTACQKEKTITEVSPTVEVNESLQQVLDQAGMTYDEMLNSSIEHKVLDINDGKSNGGEESVATRGDELGTDECCAITSHTFTQNPFPPGSCWYNSVYDFKADASKVIFITISQTQVNGNSTANYTLAAGRFSTSSVECTESRVAFPFQMLNLPGINIAVSNMYILDGSGVCAHLGDSAILACP